MEERILGSTGNVKIVRGEPKYYSQDYVDMLNEQIKSLEEERAKSIYLVWNPDGDKPKKKHNSVDEARKEARRLAEENHGAEFYVLRAVEAVRYRTGPFECRNFCKR